MKKILIVILVVIILIFAYNQYKDYKRFNPPNSNYKTSKTIDLNYFDQSVVYDYTEAVESLNGFVITQWSANEIDVKSPENDDNETRFAVNEYAKKLAKVKFYEAKLEQSKSLKEKGLTNEAIAHIITNGLTVEAYNSKLKAEKYKQMMYSTFKENNIRVGTKSPYVYEIQKLLVKKGFDIPMDGVYKNATAAALKAFEEKNYLFPDGKLDVMTLDILLK